MNDLLLNIDRVHTTLMGIDRIRRNLGLDCDVVLFCKSKILDSKCVISKRGKNWYCMVDNIVITVNSFSYAIITAHIF